MRDWPDTPDGEVTTRLCRSGKYEAFVWAPCRCGKTRMVTHIDAVEEMAARAAEVFGKVEGCRACGDDTMRRVDRCPEAGCIREGYRHEGRCEPPPPLSPEIFASLRAAANAEGAPTTGGPDA